MPRRFYSNIQGWPQATVGDHPKLLEAIQSKDAATARQEMEEHIMHFEQMLATHFNKRAASSEKSDEAPNQTQGLARV